MQEVNFGKRGNPGFFLERSDQLLALRTQPAAAVSTLIDACVENCELVLQEPASGLQVYRMPASGIGLVQRKVMLRALPGMRFVGSVLVQPGSDEPVIYTENIFIKFIDTLDASTCLRLMEQAGLLPKRQLDYATNAYLASMPEGSGVQVFQIALTLLELTQVEYCHPELIQRSQFKTIHANQWHLKSTSVSYQAEINASANVEAAHYLSEGHGTVIAVLDSSFDIDHPEFCRAGKVVAARNFSIQPHSDNPRPHSNDGHDDHGTACAGVACADGRLASGVAPKATLMPLKMSGQGGVVDADAFYWAALHGADVISCSWGPPDGAWYDPNDPLHQMQHPLPAYMRLAIEYAVTRGRGGKGCVILWAAGNGNESVDNDSYASNPNVIAVAACNDQSKRSVYSDYGKAVWCAFPSADVALNGAPPLTRGIWTTNLSAAVAGREAPVPGNGDLYGNYTNNFGGTSSACPGAAGVAALVLSVNPALHWAQVRDILKRCCDKIDPEGGKYDAAGHSHSYGYGRLNAEKAVLLARPPLSIAKSDLRKTALAAL